MDTRLFGRGYQELACCEPTVCRTSAGYGNPMTCKPSKHFVWLLGAAFFLTGCFPTQPMYLRDNGGADLSYYLDQATAIEYPDVETTRLAEVSETHAPITVVDPEFTSFYDLTLEEVVGISLQNSKVLRGYGTPTLQGTRVSPGIDDLTTGIQGAGTMYNVGIRESEPGFLGIPGQQATPGTLSTNTGVDGNQGVEAALADFDAQYSSSLFWANSDEPRNTVAPFDRTAFRQNQVTFQNELSKKTAEGTLLFLRNSNVYTANNIPLASDPNVNGFQLLPAWWRTSLEVEFRQPLMRGRGAFINRLPILISRIGTDQEIANLEAQLQNFVTNVEIRYWDLQCAYRNLEASKTGRDAALETWRIVESQFEEKADVNIQQLSQAKEQYHFFNEQVIDAYNTLLTAESDLRFLMGIAQTDGQIIRPIDEPVIAPVEFDWCSILDEALVYRPELRQQLNEVKKKELALQYAKNAVLPVVNVTGLYRFLGLGDQLVNYGDNVPNFPAEGSGAFNELWESHFQEFQLGLDYRTSIGLRRELANVTNAQIKLARERARIEDLELDITRQLSGSVRALAANRILLQEAFNRWVATSKERDHFEDLAAEGVETLDVALDAQRRLAQAEVAFYTALCEYNKNIALLHRRKGTILAYNGVQFGEGPWAGKAYHDAQELARKRSASRQVNYGWTRPGVISQGPIGAPINSDCIDGNCAPTETVTPGFDAPYYDQEMPADQEWIDDLLPQEQPYIPLSSMQDQRTPMAQQPAAIVDTQIQATSYTTGDEARSARATYMSSLNQGTANLSVPKRDLATAQPAPQKPRMTSTDLNNVDWAKFGLTRPDSNDGHIDARINTTNGNQ
ncbi:MAG: TolC family protein [Pirellulaceae bacterium]